MEKDKDKFYATVKIALDIDKDVVLKLKETGKTGIKLSDYKHTFDINLFDDLIIEIEDSTLFLTGIRPR